jgi:MoaA/NifB/PqqE/SkfB family radical SAM enzyme
MLGLNSIRWDIAQRCNLNCKHCQTGDHRANKYYETNTEEAKLIIEKLYQENVENMGLLGGEPLIREDIRELISLMSQKGMKVTINTNGLYLDEEMLQFLYSNNCSIIISLDGATQKSHEYLRGKNTFERTIERIRLATRVKKKLGINNIIGLSIVLNQTNKNEFRELYNLGQSLNIDLLSMQAVYRTGNADKFWDFLSLSGEDILNLGQEYISMTNFKYPFHVDERFLTNKAIKSLNNSLGTNLQYKFVGDGDGYRSAYIRCDGVMLPSAGLLSLPNKFEENSLIQYKVSQILETPIYNEWRKNTQEKLYKNYYEPCKECEFSGVSCFPSPNAYMMNKKIPLEICSYIEEMESSKKVTT